MSNVIAFPRGYAGNPSKLSERDFVLETEAMETALKQIQDVFAKLAIIQDELGKTTASAPAS
jgi:hypothetical protein